MYLLTTEFFSLHSTPQFTWTRDIVVEYCNNHSIHSFVQIDLHQVKGFTGRFQWPRGRRRGSSAVCFMGFQVRIPVEAWMLVFYECCLLPGRGLCVGLITHTEESYWVRGVQWAWSWSPVRGGHDPESSRSETGRKGEGEISCAPSWPILFI
jgi:hypothetical protein